MALSTLFKAVTDAVTKVAKSATPKTTTPNVRDEAPRGGGGTSSGGLKGTSSTSPGAVSSVIYDPYGQKQNGYIINGQTYLANGERLPTGWTSTDAQGFTWTMTPTGGVRTGTPGGVAMNTYMPGGDRNLLNSGGGNSSGGGGGGGGGEVNHSLRTSGGGGYAGGEYQALIDQIMGQANRDALVDQLNQALSPDYYTQNFNNIMTQLNPLYQQQRNEIMQMADQQRGQVDIDAERRGIYNSGVPANLRQDVNKMETQAIANALAQLQAQATRLVGDQQDRVLQSIGMQGDWMNSDKSSLLGLLDTMTGYDLGRLNSDRNYSLGMLNSDRDYQINMGKLGLGQQEMALNNLKFQEEQRQFDRSLAEKQRQYDLDYDFKERSFAEDVRRFESEMGLKWSQLNASNKSSWIGAELDRAKLTFQREQWADEKSAANAAQNLQRLQYAMDGYADIQAIYNSGGSKSEAMSVAGMYNQYVGSDIGSDLKKTIDSMEWTTKSSSSSSSKSGGLNQQAKDLIKGYTLGPGNMMN